jgi:hypothetical protein
MADYEELIGGNFTFGDSLEKASTQFDQFIEDLNSKGLQLKIEVGNGALDGITQQLQAVRTELSGLSSSWKEVFGGASEAAQSSTDNIKQSVASAESAFISSQKSQTEAAQVQSTKRVSIAKEEADRLKQIQNDLKAKSQVTPEVSRYGSQFLQQELQRVEAEKQARLKAPTKEEFGGAQQYGSGVVEKEIGRLESAQQKFEKSRQATLKGTASNDPLQGAGQFGSGVVEKEISRLEDAQQKFEKSRQAALKGAPSNEEFPGAQQYGSGVAEKELNRLQEQKTKATQAQYESDRKEAEKHNADLDKAEATRQKSVESNQRNLKNAPYREDPNDQFAKARGGVSQTIANELKKAEEAKSSSGIGGFFGGVGKGLAPGGDSSAASIGEFIGQATRFVAAYAAIRAAAEAAAAAIKAPFEIIKGGIEYLSEFQERASQLKTTLLDHGFFSKDPADNMKLAGEAADALQGKVDDLATKLHVKSQTIQAAFETFSGYGGNALTGNVSDSVQLAGIATGALQSQNPVIQQRTVATQLQKLTTGTLKDTDKLPAALGISAEKLNAMAKGAATTHDLLQQIEADVPGISDRIGTANDRFASLVDSAKLLGERLEGIIAKPVFDVLSEQLRNLIAWVDKNKDAINAFAAVLGEAFKSMEEALVSAGKNGAPILLSALKHAVVLANDMATHIGTAVNLLAAFHGDKSFSQAVQENHAAIDKGDNTDDNLTLSPEQARDNSKQRLSKTLAEKYHADKGYLSDPTGYNKEYASGAAGIDQTYNDRVHPKKGLGDAAIGAYNNLTHPAPAKPTGNTPADQLSGIREDYTKSVEGIKKQGAAIRSAIEEDAKAFRITLIDAADLKAASYTEEADKVTAAGKKATAAIAKVADGKDPAKTRNVKKSITDTIGLNNSDLADAAAKSGKADLDAVDKQSDAITGINQAGSATRATDLLNADYAYKQELAAKGLITDQQALDNEQKYWDSLYVIRKKGVQDSLDLEQKDGPGTGDKKKITELQQQLATLGTQQGVQNTTLGRKQEDVSYNERQRQFGLQSQRDQADIDAAGNKADVDRHAGLTDYAKPDNLALLQAQRQSLQTEQDKAVDTAQKAQFDYFRTNPNATPEQLASNPAVQAAQTKVQVINAALIKTDKLIASSYDQGQSSQEASDKLFGQAGENGHFQGTDKDGNSSAFGTIGQSAESIGNLAKGVSGGVAAVEQGYQQGGAGGAVGAGVSQIGQFIPGIAGQIVSGIGSVISTVSALFTQAAQEIGKQVGLAVDKAMAKYSEGQSTLSSTLATVTAQYNTLVAQETGRKGGQQVLDTEGLQLQQQIDQLKQQQQQTAVSFTDSTIVAGGTNSVAQQWLSTWIAVNKEVQTYENAVGTAAAVQLANQYLNEQLDAQRKQLQDQYVQGQASAVNDALQLNQLLQQRNNYEDQYRQQVFSLQSNDSLARRGNPAEDTARQISLAKSQYNQQVIQLNFQISTYQQKVAYEQQIYGLATTTAALQQQALADQGYQLQEQIAQAQTVVALLQSISGLTASGGALNIPGLPIGPPTNYGINDGSLNPIPGYGAPGTTDNSTNTINITIPAGILPATGTPNDFATAIGNELVYALRTRGSATI